LDSLATSTSTADRDSAVIRTLTRDPLMQWSGGILYRGAAVIALHAAHQSERGDPQSCQRGLIDGASLRMILSDSDLHQQHAPEHDIARLMYELLEQLRCESLAPDDLPGVKQNMTNHFLQWAREFADSGLTETNVGVLVFTVALTSWSRLTRQPIADDFSDLMESTRAAMSTELGHIFVDLVQAREEQARFIAPSLALANWVARAVATVESTAGASQRKVSRRNGFSLKLHFNSSNAAPPPSATSGSSKAWERSANRYRIFTTRYDREVEAATLVRSAQLEELRQQLDEDLNGRRLNIAKLSRIIHQRICHTERLGWAFGQDEGLLDGSRLARLISDPQEHSIFRREKDQPIIRCAVTFLLDCSGSMKTHSEQTSLMVDALSRAIERAGGESEILGFSTNSWSGGRARRDWARSGKPEDPGRLNEALHIVFKPSAVSWQRGRRGIAALRRHDLFREGIDGEAVAWACGRLRQKAARRKILIVISDGCPMDTATHQENDEYYLDQHLRQVVTSVERSSELEICALGVGLDLGCFYKRRLAIDLSSGVDDFLLGEIAKFFTSHRRHHHARHRSPTMPSSQ